MVRNEEGDHSSAYNKLLVIKSTVISVLFMRSFFAKAKIERFPERKLRIKLQREIKIIPIVTQSRGKETFLANESRDARMIFRFLNVLKSLYSDTRGDFSRDLSTNKLPAKVW